MLDKYRFSKVVCPDRIKGHEIVVRKLVNCHMTTTLTVMINASGNKQFNYKHSNYKPISSKHAVCVKTSPHLVSSCCCRDEMSSTPTESTTTRHVCIVQRDFPAYIDHPSVNGLDWDLVQQSSLQRHNIHIVQRDIPTHIDCSVVGVERDPVQWSVLQPLQEGQAW